MRAPAKRYLRTLPDGPFPDTEPECVAVLIERDRRSRMRLDDARRDRRSRMRLDDARRPVELTWFGRLLWRVFARWL